MPRVKWYGERALYEQLSAIHMPLPLTTPEGGNHG